MLRTSWRAASASVSASSLLFSVASPLWLLVTSAWMALAWLLVICPAATWKLALSFSLVRAAVRSSMRWSPNAMTHFTSVRAHFVTAAMVDDDGDDGDAGA